MNTFGDGGGGGGGNGDGDGGGGGGCGGVRDGGIEGGVDGGINGGINGGGGGSGGGSIWSDIQFKPSAASYRSALSSPSEWLEHACARETNWNPAQNVRAKLLPFRFGPSGRVGNEHMRLRTISLERRHVCTR